MADALSRMEANALSQSQPPVIDFPAVAKAQRTDPELQQFISSPQSSLRIIQVVIPNSDLTLYCDTSTSVHVRLSLQVFDVLYLIPCTHFLIQGYLPPAVADLEILSWGGQILIYFLIVVVLCYNYLGVELTETSTATGTEKKQQKG